MALSTTVTPWTLGRNITRRRRAARLTQDQLAERVHVTRQTVSRWETGRCMPERRHLLTLSLVLRVSPDQLFERDGR